MRNRMRRERGLTLIEVMVVGTIAIAIGAGVFTLFARAWANQDAILTQNTVQREARAALDLACDFIRELGNQAPWQAQIVLIDFQAGTPIIGFLAQGGAILGRDTVANKLERIGNGVEASVSDITAFNLQYQIRDPTFFDGQVHWTTVPIQNNPPNILDPNLMLIRTVIVTVTASQRGSNGALYQCTLSSQVNIRNLFYPLAPPGG